MTFEKFINSMLLFIKDNSMNEGACSIVESAREYERHLDHSL